MTVTAYSDRLASMHDGTSNLLTVRPEEVIACIWAEALRVPAVGYDDDFHLLGGTVGDAVHILGLIREKYGVALDIADFLEARTVRQLCEVLARRSTCQSIAPVQLPFTRYALHEKDVQENCVTFAVPDDLVIAMDALAVDEKVSRADIALAIFQIILHRYTDADELTLAIGLEGDRISALIAFRTHFGDDPSFSGLLKRSMDAQRIALEKDDTWIEPGDSSVVFQYTTGIPVQLGARDLGFFLCESLDELQGQIHYHAKRFDAFFMERLAGHFLTCLQDACNQPGKEISRLQLLTKPEFHQIVHDWNDTAGDYPSETLIQQAFEDKVKQTPDAIAVMVGGRDFTYRQIDERANRLGRYLKSLGIDKGSFTGICLKRSEETVIAVLAVLKAGGAYVPLDPSYPKDRLAFMLEDTKAPIVLTHTELLDRLPNEFSRYVCIDHIAQELAHQSAECLERVNQPDDLAYVIYTSGSTGQPKGVVLRHRPVVNVLDWVNKTFSVASTDRLLFVTSLSFDLSVYDIFGVLGAGGSIRIADEKELRDPASLLRILNTEPITIWDSAPAALQQLAPFFASCKPGAGAENLRLVLLSGDWIPVPLPDRVRSTFPNSRVVSLGGATEAAIWSNSYPIGVVDPKWPSIPYGKPIRNARYHILDKHLQPLPVGVAGELYIGGDVLANGYLNRNELTAERFLPDPFWRCEAAVKNGRSPARVRYPKIYKTGDRARYLPDGNIEFLGRLDTQVKIRGFRVEAGEIETLLSQITEIQEAVIKPHKDSSGQNYLVAYVVPRPGKQIAARELTRQLQTKLPEYMIPAQIVILEKMPITPNGKLDRSALLPPRPITSPDRPFEAPSNSTEAALAKIWSQVLGIDNIGRNDNFFELGGHSLRAAEVAACIQSQFHVEISLPVLFQRPTVARLAEAIEQATDHETAPLVRITSSNRAPASLIQQRFWFLDKALSDQTIYNVADSIRIDGRLQLNELQWAWNAVVARQDSLRTTFDADEGRPVQVIHPSMPYTFQQIDLSHLAADVREVEAKRLIADDARRPFDLRTGPLWRIRVIRLTDREHLLNWTIHHIIIDESSRAILLNDMWTCYADAIRGRRTLLPELPVRYIDFSLWQRERLTPESIQYWKDKLRGSPPPLSPPHPKSRSASRSHEGATAFFTLPPRLTAALAKLSSQAGVTPCITYLAAFQTLLFRYSGQADTCLGCPVTSRPAGAATDIVGCFINTLVLRTNLDGNPTFRDLLGRTRDTLVEAVRHVNVPFEKLIEELKPERIPGGHPLFQTMFVYQGENLHGGAAGGLAWKHDHMERIGAKFDVSLIIEDVPGEARGCFEYCVDLYDDETIERYVAHFISLLEGIVAQPEARLADLPILPPGELQLVLKEFNQRAMAVPPGKCVHHLVEDQAARTPDAIAFEINDKTLSFRDLNERANRLAHQLRSMGVGPDTLVGICLQRSLDAPVAMLGILKAGGAYIPLDPDFPAERLAYYASDSKMTVVVAHHHLLDRLPKHDVRIVYMDKDAVTLARQPSTNPPNLTKPEHLVYVLYTSGSTGKPNGVAISHSALVNLLLSVQKEPGLSSRDTILSLTTLSFDIHTVETWLPMISGARSVIVPREVALDGHRLAELLDSCDATVMQSTPATWRLLLTAGWSGKKNLRAFSGGEPLTLELIQQITARTAILWNMYGPTETTVYSVIHRVSPDDRLVLIGKPVANTRCYILDPNSNLPMPLGSVGEIYIGGAGLARGYLGRDELTAKRFVPDPFTADGSSTKSPAPRMYKTGDLGRFLPDGSIECLGRVDHQVKIRGFRIELNEIERVLEEHPGIAQGIVITSGFSFGAVLHAYFRCKGDQYPTPAELRKHLRRQLPDYMIPATFTRLSAFPQTPNGKVDRKALPEPSSEDSAHACERAYVAPANDAERALVALWEEVLGVKPISVVDDFHELGGHSLMAAVLMSRIETRLGHRIPIEALFDRPTVRGIADIIQRKLELSGGVIVPLLTNGSKPPLFLIAGAGGHVFAFHKFARLLGPDYPAYGMKAIGLNGVESPLDRIEKIAERYVKEIVAERPDGPYIVGGYSVGGRIALEVGLQLQALGKQVLRLIIFDMFAPGSPKPLPLHRRFFFHIKKFLQLPGHERWSYLKDRVRNMRSRFLRRLNLHEYEDPGFDGLDIVPQKTIRDVWSALIRANEAYWPAGKYDGKVVLLSSDQIPEWSEAVYCDPLQGWSRWSTRPVDLRFVSGGHMELFKDEHQEKLADIVRSIIIDANDEVKKQPLAAREPPIHSLFPQPQ